MSRLRCWLKRRLGRAEDWSVDWLLLASVMLAFGGIAFGLLRDIDELREKS